MCFPMTSFFDDSPDYVSYEIKRCGDLDTVYLVNRDVSTICEL